MATLALRRHRATTRETPRETRTELGAGLARGPALVVGTILLAVGLYALYRQHGFPRWSNFSDGTAPAGGKVFGLFAANGFTGLLTATAGGLLLFGAAQHLVAKSMSLIVGAVLGACAIAAAVSGDAFGLAAANGATEIAWGAAAVVLLLNLASPRRRREVPVGAPAAMPGDAPGRGAPTSADAPARGPVADEESRR